MTSKQLIEQLLPYADIQINGKRSWDIQVHNENFYKRVIREESLGLGESYMDGWWDVSALDQFFYKILHARLEKQFRKEHNLIFHLAKEKFLNPQRKSKAFEVGEKHYDLGNKLYEAMLDKCMVYTCGYWKDAKNLGDAQVAKLDLVCRKVGLRKGMEVLDIGCGFGGFAKYAAEKYGVSVVGISVSKEQTSYAKKVCKGLPIEFQLKDYRDITGIYDRIVSIGMFEAVGSRNFRTFMKSVYDHLKEDGLFLLHTIGTHDKKGSIDAWLNKYIFPNGELPTMQGIAKSFEGLYVMEDWHNFGADYDKTLMSWFYNFDKNWNTLKKDYDERFYRMWKYYLLVCAGSFRARKNQLWQIVLSKNGVPGGYISVR